MKYRLIDISQVPSKFHLSSSDMVRKKQPGGTEVQEEVAPITGKILIQAEF